MTDLNAGQPALLTTVSLTDFIAEFGEGLLDSLNRSNPPVYAGAAHPGRQAVMAGLKRTPFPAQADVVQAIAALLLDRGEQAGIINAEMGTGKTMMAIAVAAAHGLAYAVYGIQYQHKQAGNLRITEVARVLNTQDWELARDVVNTLNTFMASADMALDGRHFARYDGRGLTPLQERRITQVVGLAISVWKRMIDLQDAGVQITHDGYLKLYQMSRPDLSNRFGAILLDEGQDVNPVIADMVQRQRTIQVMVGDRHQQLYRFHGAQDALNAAWMADAEKHYLTQSFRFGPAVAHVTNVILSFTGETVKLQGLGQRRDRERPSPRETGLPPHVLDWRDRQLLAARARGPVPVQPRSQ